MQNAPKTQNIKIAPSRIRTCDLSLRRGSRYPAVPSGRSTYTGIDVSIKRQRLKGVFFKRKATDTRSRQSSQGSAGTIQTFISGKNEDEDQL